MTYHRPAQVDAFNDQVRTYCDGCGQELVIEAVGESLAAAAIRTRQQRKLICCGCANDHECTEACA